MFMYFDRLGKFSKLLPVAIKGIRFVQSDFFGSVAMVTVDDIGFRVICWKCKICKNRFLMGLFSGLGSVQSSPLMIVEDAKESSSVLVSR